LGESIKAKGKRIKQNDEIFTAKELQSDEIFAAKTRRDEEVLDI